MKNDWKKTHNTLQTKRGFFILTGIVFIIFLGIALFSEHGLIDTIRIYREVNILETGIGKITEDNKQLEEEINRLKNDKNYIEELARKNLGMAHENEIIYIFDEKKK